MHDEFQNRLFGTHAAARPRHDRQPPSRQPPLLRRRLCRHRTRAQRLRRRTSRSAMISLLLFTTASFHHRFCSPPLLFTTASVHHRFFFHHRRYFSPGPHRFFSPPLLSVHHRFFSPPLPSTTASFHDRFFSRPLPFTTASFHDRFFSPPRLFRPAALFSVHIAEVSTSVCLAFLHTCQAVLSLACVTASRMLRDFLHFVCMYV